MTDRSHCRVCGASAPFAAVPLDAQSLIRCASCGTVQAQHRPSTDELDRVYERAYTDGLYDECLDRAESVQAGRQLNQAYYRLFLAYAARVAPGRELVELGCGTGTFGHFASSRGWRYRGYDINATALERARGLGLDVREGAADDHLDVDPSSVAAVATWEVIEHLWSVETCLRQAADWLKPGGVLMLSTPNFASDAYRHMVARREPRSSPPIHLTFFDRSSLKKATAAVGLRPVVVFGYRLTRPGSIREIPRVVRRLFSRDEPITIFGVFRRR